MFWRQQGCLYTANRCARIKHRLSKAPNPLMTAVSEPRMIRYYAGTGLQIIGLIVTLEALLIYFGDMGPMMTTASIGAGIFYTGWFIRPKDG